MGLDIMREKTGVHPSCTLWNYSLELWHEVLPCHPHNASRVCMQAFLMTCACSFHLFTIRQLNNNMGSQAYAVWRSTLSSYTLNVTAQLAWPQDLAVYSLKLIEIVGCWFFHLRVSGCSSALIWNDLETNGTTTMLWRENERTHYVMLYGSQYSSASD